LHRRVGGFSVVFLERGFRLALEPMKENLPSWYLLVLIFLRSLPLKDRWILPKVSLRFFGPSYRFALALVIGLPVESLLSSPCLRSFHVQPRDLYLMSHALEEARRQPSLFVSFLPSLVSWDWVPVPGREASPNLFSMQMWAVNLSATVRRRAHHWLGEVLAGGLERRENQA
jgi:hypothetical protein